MDNIWKDYGKAMRKWLEEILDWQEANPDKDWLQEMGTADLEGPGSNPPPPPPPPPGT